MEFVCTVIQKPGVSVQLFGCLTIKGYHLAEELLYSSVGTRQTLWRGLW